MQTIRPLWAAITVVAVLGVMPPHQAPAQTPPPAPKLGKPTQALALQNRSSQPITQAEATVSGSSQPVSFATDGMIQPNLGATAYVPPGSCITGVTVAFKDGRQLKLGDAHECRQPLIVVTDRRIELTSATSTNPPTTVLHPGEVVPH